MALGPDYMTPEMYMGFYRNMVVTLADDSVVQVDIRKYLNAGKVIPPPPPGEQPKKPKNILETRATAANKEYWLIMSQVGSDPYRDSPGGKAKKVGPSQVPLTFQIHGEVYNRKSISRAYMGKGSSLDIARALRLASRYRTITTEGYCDKFLGLDCTGFVCNYWGLAKTEIIDHKDFDVNRRKDLANLKIGDALVYYAGPQSSQHKTIRSVHIAVVNEVETVVKSGSEATLTMNYVESAGDDEGVHKSQTRNFLFKQNGDGEYYYHTANSARTGYLCGGPPKNRPNGF
jgi:hypothetical protein